MSELILQTMHEKRADGSLFSFVNILSELDNTNFSRLEEKVRDLFRQGVRQFILPISKMARGRRLEARTAGLFAEIRENGGEVDEFIFHIHEETCGNGSTLVTIKVCGSITEACEQNLATKVIELFQSGMRNFLLVVEPGSFYRYENTLENLFERVRMGGGDIALDYYHKEIIDSRTVAICFHEFDIDRGYWRLDREIRQLCDDGYTRFLIDLEFLQYTGDIGPGYLINLSDRLESEGMDVVLIKMPSKVKIVFDMLGLYTFFNIFATREEAMAYFARREQQYRENSRQLAHQILLRAKNDREFMQALLEKPGEVLQGYHLNESDREFFLHMTQRDVKSISNSCLDFT